MEMMKSTPPNQEKNLVHEFEMMLSPIWISKSFRG